MLKICTLRLVSNVLLVVSILSYIPLWVSIRLPIAWNTRRADKDNWLRNWKRWINDGDNERLAKGHSLKFMARRRVLETAGITRDVLLVNNWGLTVEKEQQGNISIPSGLSYRQVQVRKEFIHAWDSYCKYAWGKDVLLPISGSGEDDGYGMALTMVDNLDSLLIFDLPEQFNKAVDYVEKNLDIHKNKSKLQFFEVVIRILGGLISAYELAPHHPRFLIEIANEIAEVLIACYVDRSAVPHSWIDLSGQKPRCFNKVGTFKTTTAEAVTMLLEFTSLARHTGDEKYNDLVRGTLDFVFQQRHLNGLLSERINIRNGRFKDEANHGTGPGTDSAYEYIYKFWQYSEGLDGFFVDRDEERDRIWWQYMNFTAAIREHLTIARGQDRAFLRECVPGRRCHNIMWHLSCFYPGILAMGSSQEKMRKEDSAIHLQQAKRIARTCIDMYRLAPTGLAPELVVMSRTRKPAITAGTSKGSIGRPETVESLFYLWRVTGEEVWREEAWEIFKAIRRNMRVAKGYASLRDFRKATVHSDRMESFLPGETFKYLYLMFSDEETPMFPLESFVFNTEAHPLRIFI